MSAGDMGRCRQQERLGLFEGMFARLERPTNRKYGTGSPGDLTVADVPHSIPKMDRQPAVPAWPMRGMPLRRCGHGIPKPTICQVWGNGGVLQASL